MGVDRRLRAEVFSTGFPVAASSHHVREAVRPHVHDFLELAVLTYGSAGHRTAAGLSRLEPGDVVVIRPGSWHAYELPGELESFGVLNAYVGSELVHGQLAWLLDYPQLARLLLFGGRLAGPLPAERRQRVTGWLMQLSEEQAARDVNIKAALLGCILVELSRALAAEPDAGGPRIGPPVRRAMQCLADDLTHGWSMTELAELAGVSASSLYRQFRLQLGSGPVEWLTRSRAERAAALLTQTDLPVAAIGRRVGWSDPSYASRRFAQVYGMAPTAYRAAHTG